MLAHEFADLKAKFGTATRVWESLLELAQAASSLSFAARACSFSPDELVMLHKHGKDMVRLNYVVSHLNFLSY